MGWFTCKHPAAALAVEKKSTVKNFDADFLYITHHLRCVNCQELVNIEYAQLKKSPKEFLGVPDAKSSRAV